MMLVLFGFSAILMKPKLQKSKLSSAGESMEYRSSNGCKENEFYVGMLGLRITSDSKHHMLPFLKAHMAALKKRERKNRKKPTFLKAVARVNWLWLQSLCYLRVLIVVFKWWMTLFHVLGFGVKIGQLFWRLCCWFVDGGIEDKSGLPVGSVGDPERTKMITMKKNKMWFWNKISGSGLKIPSFSHQFFGSVRFGKTWWRKLVVAWVVFWV
ncbi:unnamed protein product [Thlaspi arvense]|uniref:Transmembrane protein n=1 Tax=Thlaspi arvense TaxID=13288 RepID=A0AAU9S9A9_THLAR|nr:unnamed protein product [Thlaspi arvense]